MWKDLTIGQKSEVMRLAVQQGFSDLNNIKEMYDAATSVYNTSSNNTYDNVPYNPSPKDVRYDDGGWLNYLKWKDAIGKYKGIDTNDPAYDYAGFYIENPKRAWALLNDDPNAHFVDTYKTVYHPTFSDESMYSGMVSPQYNPEGLIGGSWRKYPDSFTMSTDLYRSPVSMDERIQYLENNEPEGIVLREYDGNLPMFNDGSLWGGVKPTVEVSPHAYGGPLGNIYKGTGNKSQKLSKAERQNRAMWSLGQPFYKEMKLWDTGLSDVALAGILGNIGLESGFDYKATNGTHHGYLQNQDSIRDYIKKYYGGYGHKEQMQYLHDGLVGKLRGGNTSMGKQMQARFNGYIKAVANVTDPVKASQLWEQHYERSGGQAMGARQQYAKHFYDQISATAPGAFRRAKLDGTSSPIKGSRQLVAQVPTVNMESPIFHTAANDLQWQPTIVASSRQEDIAPLLVQDNKPLIVEPLEDTSPTPKDFSAIWDQIFPKVENAQEEFNPLLDPSTQFTALQSRPRYQMKPTPIINMPVSNGDNDYMLFKPLAKGGNLFEDGSYLRNYQWLTMPQTDTTYMDYETGLPIQAGQKVWADAQGNLVTVETPNALEDYAAQYKPNASFYGPTLDQVNVTGTANPNKPMPAQPDAFAERYAQLLAAPIASNADVDKVFEEQAKEQTYWDKDIRRAAADRRYKQISDQVNGMFIYAPLAATLAPILGYEAATAAPALYSWLTGTTAGQGLVASTLGGEAVETLSKFAGYNGFGDMMTKNTGWGNEMGWSFANPGYLLSPSKAVIGTAERVAADALGNVKVLNPLMESLKSTMTDYSRSMFGIDPSITGYITANTINKLNPTFKDIAYAVSHKPKYKYFNADDISSEQLLPSFRKAFSSLQSTKESLKNYLDKGRVVSSERRPVLVELTYGSPGYSNYITKGVKQWSLRHTPYDDVALNSKGIVLDNVNPLIDYLRESGYSFEALPVEGKLFDPIFKLPGNSMLNRLRLNQIPTAYKEDLAKKVAEINSILGDRGHVTGSSITALQPYATHIPGDIDIVTTEGNIEEVLRSLSIDPKKVKYYGLDHFNVMSPQYGKMDIQVIRGGKNVGTSEGMVARETYAKAFPAEYWKLHDGASNFKPIPMSPEELYAIHKSNVNDFSQIDQFLTGSDKHISRNLDLLAHGNEFHINRAYENMINAYRGVYGNEFKTLENQGIHIDYSNVEANKKFLKGLGVDNEEILDMLAKDKSKMKFIAEEYAYQHSTATRTINFNDLVVEEGQTIEDAIRNAIYTNASYSNYGGNWARYLFGGSPSAKMYGHNKGVVSATQFPIKNSSDIKTTDDLFNEISRYSVSPNGDVEQIVQAIRHPLPKDVIQQIKELYNIPETEKIETLNDVLPYTVRNRHTGIHELSQKELAEKNNKLAKILNFDYIYSAQPGFDSSFIGRYSSDVNDLTTTNQFFDGAQNAVGYELPKIGFSKSIPSTYIKAEVVTPRTPDDLGHAYIHPSSEAMKVQTRKLNTAASKLAETASQERDLLIKSHNKQRKIRDNIAKSAWAIGITGATIPLGSYMYNKTKQLSDIYEMYYTNIDDFKNKYNPTDEELKELSKLDSEFVKLKDDDDSAFKRLSREQDYLFKKIIRRNKK